MSIKIDQAMDSTVLNGGLATDLIYENGAYHVWGGSSYTLHRGVYTPDAEREYIELKTFPASSIPLSLKHSDDHVGLYQAIIKYPTDVGAIIVKQKAEAFLDLFTIGSSVVYNSQKVYISSKNRDGGRTEGGFYQIVCTINYRAFVTR